MIIIYIFFYFQLVNAGHLENCPRKPYVKIKHFNPPLLTDSIVVIIRLLGAEEQCLINVAFKKRHLIVKENTIRN